MRWDELDLDARTWTLPPERRKTGGSDPEPFVIALAPQALAAIKRQPRLEGSPFVFWGRRDRSQFDFQNALLDRVKKAAGIPNWRLQDLRRTARTGMATLGVSQVVAELCLGHNAKPGLVGVYDRHDYAPEMKAAWLKWARHVRKLTK
jgi:integrase